MIARLIYRCTVALAIVSVVVAAGCIVRRWEIVPVEHPGPHAHAPRNALAVIVPKSSRMVRDGDTIFVASSPHAPPRFRHVQYVHDSVEGIVQIDAKTAAGYSVHLPRTTWRSAFFVAYLGLLYAALVGPVQCVLLLCLGLGLLAYAEREGLRRWVTRGRGSVRRWRAVVLGTMVLVMVFAAASAHAYMRPAVTQAFNVNAKNPFTQRPSCSWTGGAEVTVSWTSDPDATSYDVLRATSSGGPYNSIANVNAATLTYADGTVNPDPLPVGRYFYKIQVNTAGAPHNTRLTDSTTCPGYTTTWAGGVGPDATATSVSQHPETVSIVGSTMYVSDSIANVIRAIDMNTGAETTIAGTGAAGDTGDGGPASLANLHAPGKVVADSNGNLYFSDTFNMVVRKIALDGTISVYAGTSGVACNDPTAACGDGGAATSASLYGPTGLAIDGSDNLYIADTIDHRVRMVAAANGHISTIAGTGNACDDRDNPGLPCGDGGDATAADLNHPMGLALDGGGNLYIADSEDMRVREVRASDGKIVNFAGNSLHGRWGGDEGADSSARTYEPIGLWPIASHPGGFLLAEQGGRVRLWVEGVAIQGGIGFGSSIGTGDYSLLNASTLAAPTSVIADATLGNIFVADTNHHSVRVVGLNANVPTFLGPFAGNGISCVPSTDPCGDGGPAANAQLSAPAGMAIDQYGNVYVADRDANRVRRISPTGIITNFAGSGHACAAPTDACGDGGDPNLADLNGPTGLWWAGDSLLIADSGDNRIRKVGVVNDYEQHDISTVAGTGTAGNTGDGGAATSATLNDPEGVLRVDDNNIYVSDTGNHRVRVFALGGNIAAFAGTGVAGSSGDGGAATSAKLASPIGLAYYNNTLYIADTIENRVRKVSGGVIDAALGDGTPATFGGDGGTATDASVGIVEDVAWDASTNSLYIAADDNDTASSRIRKVHAGVITTAAGDDYVGYLGDGGQATNARLGGAHSVAVDGAGNFYVGERLNRVRKVDVNTGVITTYAGTGEASFADAAAPTGARFQNAQGIARDADGNTWIADTMNNRVRKIAANGVVTSIGNGTTPTYSGDGGAATNASMLGVNAVARDSRGNIYVAEGPANRVRRISRNGEIETVVGTGLAEDSGDTGPGATAPIDYPLALAVDASDNLYIATNEHRIRKLDASNGEITTVAGDGSACVANGACGDGGAATSAQLSAEALAFDGAGNLYVADYFDNRIRKIDAGGNISTFAGTGLSGSSGDGGNATSATFNGPTAIAWDSGTSTLYISDSSNHKIRAVNGGTINTVVGTGASGNSGDGGAGTSATIDQVYGLAVNPVNGSVFLADSTNHRIRVLHQNGTIDAFTGDAGGASGFGGDGGTYDSGNVRLNTPEGLSYYTWSSGTETHGALLIADYSNRRLREIALDQNLVWTVAGGGAANNGDADNGANAQFNNPTGVAVDGSGNVYVADHDDNRVRLISGSSVSTIAGTGTSGGSGDGGSALQATLNNPTGVAVDGSGNVYITDTGSDRVRMVDANTGEISTIAGTGSQCVLPTDACGDGGNATDANLNGPVGIAIYGGDVYFTDMLDYRVRKVHAGVITTVAGDGNGIGLGGNGDGGAATAAHLDCPSWIVFDSNGNLFISEACGEEAVRRVDHNTGHISTVSKVSGDGISGDLGGAPGVRFGVPGGLAVDGSDNLYVVGPHDGSTRIRKIVGPL